MFVRFAPAGERADPLRAAEYTSLGDAAIEVLRSWAVDSRGRRSWRVVAYGRGDQVLAAELHLSSPEDLHALEALASRAGLLVLLAGTPDPPPGWA